jgi:hypothetical protein
MGEFRDVERELAKPEAYKSGHHESADDCAYEGEVRA